jgi:hypothetical protein
MSVTGVNNSLRDLLASRIDQTIGRPLDNGSSNSTIAKPTTATTAVPAKTTAGKQSALTPQAPAGTDPELWSVLTNEERNFFANHASSGPLTYSKVMMPNRSTSSAIPAVRGGRVDIRA